MKHLRFPKAPKRVTQKFHFAILRIEVTRASRGLSAIAELLVKKWSILLEQSTTACTPLMKVSTALGLGKRR